MDGPNMFGGRGPPQFEDDDMGRGGFRGDDNRAGDSLAMGMDVDIPAATTAGDRREVERRRGREGRCSSSAVLHCMQLFKSLKGQAWLQLYLLLVSKQRQAHCLLTRHFLHPAHA